LIDAALSVVGIEKEPYEPRGIFNSEMALLIGLCRKLGVEVVIESGRARGQSTFLLGKYLPGVAIHSVERQRDSDALFAERRLDELDNVTLWYGDGLKLVPQIVQAKTGRRIAILLDGPKGHPALDLLKECTISPDVVVGFIHDMRRVDHDEPAPFRLAAEKMFPGAFFTDDPDYVEATKHLDAPVWALGSEKSQWVPFNIGGEHTGSYGPTLGVFVMENS
jgi:hypothetical protein